MKKTLIIITVVLIIISGGIGYYIYSVHTNFNYDISTYSEEDIVKECMKILDSQIYTNPPISEYYSTFKEPLGIVEVNEDKVLLRYYKNQKIRPKNDIITSVSTNYTKELNGEIYFRNTSGLDSITVTLIIHDYEKATNVFNKLAETLAPNFSDVEINNNGAHWSATGLIEGFSKGDAADLMGVARKDFVKIRKDGDYYIIEASTYTGKHIADMYRNVF